MKNYLLIDSSNQTLLIAKALQATHCAECLNKLDFEYRDFDTYTTLCCGYLYSIKIEDVTVTRDIYGI